MSQKRQQGEEGTSFDDKRSKKSSSFRSVVLDVMNIQRLQNLMTPVLEPLIRQVVKEEVDSALRKYIISVKRNSRKDILASESRSLQLQFSNAISLPVFTGARIEGEGSTTLEVALVDVPEGQVVTSDVGSSARVEIVVLEGDFDGDEGDNWTHEEFTINMVRQREGKKPLLNGDVILTLKDGRGLVDVSFTDNSSWTRSRKFRLGARMFDDIGGIRVREARSEPFVVRDHRGELYKKHHPPSLSDEVWRLEKIGKDGAFHKRLSRERVNTVQDFLVLLYLDPTRLRNILGSGMSAKKWEVTVEHARTCVLDKRLYFYNGSTSLETNGVVFNVVGQVMGVFSNGQYVITDKLSEVEKAEARELVISAYANRDGILTLEDESILNVPPTLCPSNSHQDSNSDKISRSTYSCPSNSHQDSNSDKISRSTYSQNEAFSPDFMQSLCPIGSSTNFDGFVHGLDPMDIRYEQPLSFPSQVTDTLIYDTDPISEAFGANENLNYFDTDSTLNPFGPCSVVPIDKVHKGWNILLYVLRWKCSIKRIVRKTRIRAILQYDDVVSKYVP